MFTIRTNQGRAMFFPVDYLANLTRWARVFVDRSGLPAIILELPHNSRRREVVRAFELYDELKATN